MDPYRTNEPKQRVIIFDAREAKDIKTLEDALIEGWTIVLLAGTGAGGGSFHGHGRFCAVLERR